MCLGVMRALMRRRLGRVGSWVFICLVWLSVWLSARLEVYWLVILGNMDRESLSDVW